MILKLSLTVLLLYYLVVLWKYYRQDIAGIFGTAETDEDTEGTGKEPGQPGEPYTVMGESTYLPFGAEDGEEAALCGTSHRNSQRRSVGCDPGGNRTFAFQRWFFLLPYYFFARYLRRSRATAMTMTRPCAM